MEKSKFRPPDSVITNMADKFGIAAILFFSWFTVVQSQQHPCYVTGSEHGQILDCSNMDLTSFPASLPQDTVELDLNGNPIEVLPDSAALQLYLPNIRTLKMKNCLLTSLPSNAFAFMPSLQTLILTGNKIEQISVDAFSFTDLESLSLDENLISRLPSNTFNNMKLSSLHLGGNLLDNLPDDAFDGATIENLNLDRNRLSALPRRLLEPLQDSLKYFEISNNAVKLEVDPDTFEGFKLLRTLVMSNSQIEDTNFLKFVETYTLDLSDTQTLNIQRFSDRSKFAKVQQLYLRNVSLGSSSIFGFLDNFIDVSIIDLSHNQFMTFLTDSLSHLPNLIELRLNHNQLIGIPSDIASNIPSLRELNLANNSISTIRSEDLVSATSLTLLNLENNNIQIMDKSVEDALDAIDILQFRGNPFHCNCEMRWFREWMDVRERYLSVDYCITPQKVFMTEVPAKDFRCVAPNITYMVEDVTEPWGGEAFLTCIAQGDPAPNVEWRAPFGEVVSITPPQSRSQYKTSVYWHLSQIQDSHVGVYVCVASNMIGEVSKSVTVSLITTKIDTTTPSTTTSTSTSTTTTTIPTTTESTTESTTTSEPTTEQPSSSSSTTTTTASTTTPFTTFVDTSSQSSSSSAVTQVMDDLTVAPDDKSTLIIIIAVVLGAIVLIIVFAVVIGLLLRRRRNSRMYEIDRVQQVKHYLYKQPPMPNGSHNGHLPQKTANGHADMISSV